MKELLLELARKFAESDVPAVEAVYYDEQVNDIAKTPLSSKRQIKITIEYSDIPEKEQ
jgi:hypothetical protein